MNICFVDIEASNLDADFGMVLGAVVKPYHSEPIILRCDEQRGWKSLDYTDKELVIKLAATLREFDLWVTYFGTGFDLKYIDSRLLKHGEQPFYNRKLHLDLFFTAKSHLKISRKSLDVVSRFLETKHRKTPIPFDLWVPVIRGYKPALDKLMEHCVLDVVVLEEAYERLKGFVREIKR